MDTLSRGNRIYFLLFSILFFVYSCHYNNEDNFENTSRDIAKSEYDIVYKSVTDSVKLWASLNFASFDEDKNGFIIDKIICFNSEVNKCVMSISQQDFEQKEYQSTADYMQFLYGVKIDSIWYYFKGANIVLPREMYQKDVTKPLSFEKLHEIALKEVFSGYLKEKKPIVPFWKFWQKQEYEIDESYFDKHFRGQGWGGGDWIEDPDGSNGHWNGRIYTDEEFNKMYKEKALSVWPSSNPLTSFYDINIKRWRNIHQDSFDILLKAKKINPNGTAVE
jgi:hypothetical protein